MAKNVFIFVLAIVSVLAVLGLAFSLTVLLPLAFTKSKKNFSSTALIYVSYLFGADLWMVCIAVLWDRWGVLGVILGLLLTYRHLLAFPAVVACAFHGDWQDFAAIIVLQVVTVGSRTGGAWLKAKIAREQGENEPVRV